MFAHLKAVWTYRYFWLSLVQMDLMTRYRRSVLGIGWSLLYPLGMTAVFCVVFSQLYNQGWGITAANTLAGMAVWEFLRSCTLGGCRSLQQNEAYIRQAPLPYGIYPLRTMMSLLFHFVISLGLLLVLVWALNGPMSGYSGTPGDPSGQAWMVFARGWTLLPVVLLAAVFGWALATVAAFATTYFHDIGHMLEVAAQLFFFLTPVIWTRATLKNPFLTGITDYNPAAIFIDLVRRPLIDGVIFTPVATAEGVPPDTWTYPSALGAAAVITAVAVTVAFATIGGLQKKVIFHM